MAVVAERPDGAEADARAASDARPDAPRPAPLAPPPVADAFARVRQSFGSLAGFALVAVTNAIAIVATIHSARGSFGVRFAHVAFDTAETFGLGVLTSIVIGLWLYFLRPRVWVSLTAYFAIALPIAFAAVEAELYRQACVALNGRFALAIYGAFVVLCGAAIPAAHALGALLSRWRWTRIAALVVVLGGIVVNHAVLRDDQPGMHSMIGWAAATLSGALLAPTMERLVRALARTGKLRPVAASAALVGAIGLFVPPPNRIRVELFREPGSLAPWVLARIIWSTPRVSRHPSTIAAAWLADRASAPPIPPTTPRLVPNPVVLFITIDSVRADTIEDRKNDSVFPLIAELKRTGAYFTHATAPGSQTAVSLTAVFSGRYFSQLYWSYHGYGVARFVYASDDPTERFPSLLDQHGVVTADYCPVNFLASDFGVLRGFKEEHIIPKDRRHAFAREVIDPLVERLRSVHDEPFFGYVHLMEPHFPYDRGKQEGTQYERYVSEIGVADIWVARAARTLWQLFPTRGYVIVAADHGEAFGEHDTTYHTKTLYEELVRVPLLIRGPGIVPRRIDRAVTLMDVGPTILDLFGVPTPAAFMGQSLVPLLRGSDAPLERPILAEGRLRRVLYAGNLKVIEDERRQLVEAYDLAADRAELDDRFDAERDRFDPALASLREFFAQHELKRAGYSPPYKP